MRNRIRELRKKHKMTMKELGQALGLAESTVSHYETGRRDPDLETLLKMGELFNVSVGYILMAEPAYESSDSLCFDNISPISVHRIPLLGSVACGKPVYADEEFQYYVAVGAEIRADFALHAKGDSMIGARINDGDIVFVRQTNAVDNGEIAVVIIGDEATLKRVYYYPEKSILILKAENPKYDDMVYSDSELEQIRILGKAVAVQADVR